MPHTVLAFVQDSNSPTSILTVANRGKPVTDVPGSDGQRACSGPGLFVPQAPDDTPEHAQSASGIRLTPGETAQQQAQIVPVGLLHGWWRVARCGHRIFHDLCEPVERAGISRRLSSQVCQRLGAMGPGQLVEAHCDSLPKVHRGLVRVGRNLNQQMAAREIVARQPMFLRPENKSDASSTRQFFRHPGHKHRKKNSRLLGLAMRAGAGSHHQRATSKSFGERGALACIL